jgi:hypothetical protein
MTIDNLLKIYPNLELMADENNPGTEYFSPPPLITQKPDGSPDTFVTFEVESDSGAPLSSSNAYPTRSFSKKGRISKICVLKWQ